MEKTLLDNVGGVLCCCCNSVVLLPPLLFWSFAAVNWKKSGRIGTYLTNSFVLRPT